MKKKTLNRGVVTVLLYVALAVALLLVLNLQLIWRFISSHSSGAAPPPTDFSHLSKPIFGFADKFATPVLMLFWAGVGFVCYGFVVWARAVFGIVRRQTKEADYVKPVQYQKTYLQRILWSDLGSVGLILGWGFYVFLFFKFILLWASRLLGDGLNPIAATQRIGYITGAILLMAISLYILAKLGHLLRLNLWNLAGHPGRSIGARLKAKGTYVNTAEASIEPSSPVQEVKQHPIWQLVTVGLIFVALGGYLTYHSFAISNPPTMPTSLQTNPVSSSEIDLSWGASTSNAGVAGYDIYEMGFPIDSGDTDNAVVSDQLVGQTSDPNSTTFKITGLDSDTTYSFYVEARDTQGNVSTPSEPATDSTLDDSQASGNFAVRDTSSASASTWPYKNPFGDKSCQKIVNGTPTIFTNCVCQTTGGVTCDGSCVDSAYAKSIGVDPNTYVCRPGGTIKFNGENASAVSRSVQDEGVDYGVIKYERPFENLPHTPLYMYAMGNGVITNIKTGMKPAVFGNGSFGPNWITYKLKGNGSKGTADGLTVYIAEYCNLSTNAVNDVTATSGTGNSPGDEHLGRKWKIGDSITANSILCTMPAPIYHYSKQNGNTVVTCQCKGIEIGWAPDGSSAVLAQAYGCYAGQGHIPTEYGFSFSQFIYKSLGPRGQLLGAKNVNGRLVYYVYKDPTTGKHYRNCSAPDKYKGNWF